MKGLVSTIDIRPHFAIELISCSGYTLLDIFMKRMPRGDHVDWKRLLVYISGTVDQELLLRNE